MKRILLSLIFCATPTLHAASLLDDAKAIEKKMDETTPAISHSMSNKVESVTPEMGQKIMDVSDMVGDLTTAAVDTKGKIDDETFEAICHVIARNGLYDQMGESVDTRFTKKFRARLDKVFTKFQNERKPYEKGRPFDEKRMEQIRVQLDMAVSAQQEGAKKKRS